MIDHKLYTFLEVCQSLSFTKAAEQLYITQPAVTQQMKTLEDYYGTKLFCYQGKRLCLTKAGITLKTYAASLTADSKKVREAVGKTEDSNRELVFGATLTIGEYVLPDPLIAYQMQHRDIRLTMKVDNTSNLLFELKEGRIDFAFIEGYYPKEEYEVIPLAQDRLIAVCSTEHTYANGTWTISQLFDQPLVIREEGSGTREVLERALAQKNHSITEFGPCTQIGNINVIKHMVEQNLGITFLYESAVRSEIRERKLSEITLSDFFVTKDYSFVCLKGSCFYDEYRRFLQELIGNF